MVLAGRAMIVEPVVEQVFTDADYFRASGGSLIVSGGETPQEHQFVRHLFEHARALGIHNAQDTASSCLWSTLAAVLPMVPRACLAGFRHPGGTTVPV
jgi:pyruvate-formate lyase-activating enzyme